uniref:Helicase ATP-binding domain-containing protein n=1 Tax=Panagrolaimus sp. PS1159 TaxID=55785 RepID=A0AC35FLR0_9BILA
MKRSNPIKDENYENALPPSAKKPWKESMKEENAFSFPFKPYSTQLRLMNDMNEILKNRGIGIFESPTGTGKSLTSLCAVLTFVENENRKLKEFVEENRKKAKQLREGNGDEDFEKALENFKEAEKFHELADTEEEKLLRTEKRIEEARKRLQAYKFQEEIEIEDCGLPRASEPLPELTKVVFSTRTHSQIEQLTFELKRTRFQPRVVSLGSRALLCINSEVKNLPNSAAADKCKDLRDSGKCPFYKRTKVTLLSDHILDGVTRDLKDVIRESKNLHSCGYYASREALPFCELIFVPYATLFDSEMRKSAGLSIDDKTIVVIDEAHNLFATLTEMSSAIIDLNLISLGLEILEKFLDAKVERTKGVDFKNLKLFENALKQIETLISGPHFLRQDEKKFPVYKFMNELFKNDGLRFIQAIENAKKANLLPRIYSYYRSPAYFKVSTEENETKSKKGLKSFLSRKTNEEKVVEFEAEKVPESQGSFPLFSIADFLISLGSAGENFQVIVDVISTPRKIQLLCLNGGEKFASIVSNARSTVLIGGTMRPTDLITSLLTKDCGIERTRIIDNSYDHIIDATNLRIVSIEKDSIGPLTFTHTTLKDKTIFTRLLDSLHPFIKSVSNGLAIFFPSKAFLSTFLNHIKQLKNQQFNDLVSRNLFIEGETLDVWEKYSKKAKTSKATLFAVIGGKFSEGVNFSDELARAVIIVGLPYPNMLTPEFRAKTEYLRNHFSSNSEISTNLAMNICMTQVNQTIGRVVRHKLDYGIVVLLDSRYSEKFSLISKWAQPSLLRCSTSQDAFSMLKEFRGILDS